MIDMTHVEKDPKCLVSLNTYYQAVENMNAAHDKYLRMKEDYDIINEFYDSLPDEYRDIYSYHDYIKVKNMTRSAQRLHCRKCCVMFKDYIEYHVEKEDTESMADFKNFPDKIKICLQ